MLKYFAKVRIVQLLSILLITLLCCINFRELNYIAVLNDEFGYWSNAVSIMGYNWKDLIAETPYYTWGYSIWLIPIVLLFSEPELWYKAAIILNIFFLILSYFLCCKVGEKLFPKINKAIIYCISLLTIIYPGNIIYAQVSWSESLLYLLMWIGTYVLIRLEEKFTYIKAITFTLILLYMYTVHARTIGVIFIGIIVLLLILLKNRKSFRLYMGLILIIALGYLFIGQIKEYQIAELWNNSTASNANNVGLDQNTILLYLERIINNLRLLVESFGGKLIYIIIGTGLTFPIVVIQFFKEQIVNIKQKDWWNDYTITKFWCIFTLIVEWCVCSLQMVGWTGRKDMIVYSRYMENAIGPVLLLGIIYAIFKIKETRQGVILSLIVLLLGLRNVYWRVLEAEGTFNTICSPVVGGFYEAFNRDPTKTFIAIAVTCAVIALIIFVCTFYKRVKLKLIVVMLCLGAVYAVLGYYDSRYTNEARNYFDKSTVAIRAEIEDKFADAEIYYVKNENDPYSVRPKYLQFTIPDKTIHLVDGEDINRNFENTLILINPLENEYIEEIESSKDIEFVLSTNQLNLYYIK